MQVRQPGREVVADDLRRGLPQWLVEDSVAGGGIVAQIAVDLAGHEAAAQDGAERVGREEPARLRCKVRDRRVRLLCREAALFDRDVGAVAGGVHAIESRHASRARRPE